MSTPPAGRLNNKVALITGAASGIGKATAVRFAREGAKVAVTDRNRDGAEQTAEVIEKDDGKALAVVLDVTDESAWEAAITQVSRTWGGLQVLVNNAGITSARPLTEVPLEEWRTLMAVNLDGVFLGLKHGIAAMRRQGRGGSVVNVSSASGHKASPGAAAYCASKAGVSMLTRTAALECAHFGDGIRVNAVVPAGVVTPMWQSAGWWQKFVAEAGSEEAAYQKLADTTPMRRFATADEVASAILFLASDEASYVTGSELVVDGGYTA